MNEMTYLDGAKGVRISRERALQELRKHGIAGEDAAEVLASLRWRNGTTSAYSLLTEIGY